MPCGSFFSRLNRTSLVSLVLSSSRRRRRCVKHALTIPERLMSATEGRGLTRFETVTVAAEEVVVVGVVGGEVVVALTTVVAETGPVILGGVVEVEGVEAVQVCVTLTLNCLQKKN